MEENINALDEISKGACMGMDALDFVMEKVEDQDLLKALEEQYKDYKKISRKINSVYKDYDDDKPHKTSIMNKVMTWSGVEMETMFDKSNSNIAEFVLKGINMGIVEGRKILNKKCIDKEIEDLVSEYVRMQEKNVEVLKKYL